MADYDELYDDNENDEMEEAWQDAWEANYCEALDKYQREHPEEFDMF